MAEPEIKISSAAVKAEEDKQDEEFEDAEEGEAPTLVEAKLEDEAASNSKLKQELEDESPKTFPQVLMDILNDEEDQDTIAWLPHGRSFIIYKKKKFATKVLPRFFKATKFTSFTRKLNRWGFTRVTRGPEMGSYFHKMFLRDEPSFCLRMSSHSSSKFQDGHHHLMPAPMAMPFGMPIPFMPGMLPPHGTADMAQQNQFINQQLQQLQWQQFQLQQFQQQQHHTVQQQVGLPQSQIQHSHMMHGQPPPTHQQHHAPALPHHGHGQPIQPAPSHHHHTHGGMPPSHGMPQGSSPGGPPQDDPHHNAGASDMGTSNKGSAV